MWMRRVSSLLIVLALSANLLRPAAAVASAPQQGAEAQTGGGAHGQEGKIDPFYDMKTDLALWTVAVFVILLVLLWRFAWGPIAEGLAKREQRVHEEIAAAENANSEAKRLLAGYEQRLANAQNEVRALLELARGEAAQTGRELIDKARAEAEIERQRALQEIDAATAVALKELADRSATLAVELAGKIIRAKLKPEDHARLIQQAVAGVAARTPSSN